MRKTFFFLLFFFFWIQIKKYVCICCIRNCYCSCYWVTFFYFLSVYFIFSSSYVQQLQLMLHRMDMCLSSVNMHFAWFFPRCFCFVPTYNNRSRSSLSASLVNESVSVYSSRFRRQHGGSLSSSSSSLQCSNSSLWCSNSIRLGNNVSHPLQLQRANEKESHAIKKMKSVRK